MGGKTMKALRAVRSVFTALVLVAGAGLVAAAPASAAPITCNLGTLCVWDQPAEAGGYPPANARKKALTPAYGACLSLQTTWDDGTTSRAQFYWDLIEYATLTKYESEDCSGDPLSVTDSNTAGTIIKPRSFRKDLKPDGCDRDKICFWENTDFTGAKSTVEWGNFCRDTGGIAARSVANNTGSTISLYQGSTCLGAAWLGDVQPGGRSTINNDKTVGRWNLA